jgi:hypothetical protein
VLSLARPAHAICREEQTFYDEDLMKVTISLAAIATVTTVLLMDAELRAQDIPGIEICTVEKTMERRTSCLQSNIEFLQKTLARLSADHQQKLDAANRQIEGLKATVTSLQKLVADLHAAQRQTMEEQKKKADTPPSKDAPKEGGK